MAKKRGKGRPRSVMTPDTEKEILDTVRLGVWPERAAQIHGIATATLRAHRARHPDFATELEKAEAQAEAFFHSKILRATDRQWTAAAWMLERRWSARYGKKDPEVEVNVNNAAPTGPTPPPTSELGNYIASLTSAAANLGIIVNTLDPKKA